MTKGKNVNDHNNHILIDPANETVVIVSKDGYTRLWVDGKEIMNAVSIKYSHKTDRGPVLDIKIM